METRKLILLLGITGLGVAGPLHAMTYAVEDIKGKNVLLAEGGVETDESERFLKAVRQAGPISEVWFNSPGGAAIQGIETGRLIRKLGLATRIPSGAICASACSYAFLGGVIRHVDSGGKYGVHMFSQAGSQGLVKNVMNIIKKYGAEGAEKVIRFLEQDAAKTARERAHYLGEMSVSLRLMIPAFETSSDDIHWLSPSELRDYNVVNVN
ncbi:MAG: hypothetical protein ACXWT1_04125 [Methylobacter sp.]